MREGGWVEGTSCQCVALLCNLEQSEEDKWGRGCVTVFQPPELCQLFILPAAVELTGPAIHSAPVRQELFAHSDCLASLPFHQTLRKLNIRPVPRYCFVHRVFIIVANVPEEEDFQWSGSVCIYTKVYLDGTLHFD